MQKFEKHEGLAAVLDRADVDTDQIIPKQFLKKIERTGFGVHLFHDWRFLDDAGEKPNPDFILNASRFQGATVLVAGMNFGCGSSREHAPWALLDYGFRVIIAPSFADIFYNNCFKNGMLPVELPAEQVREIMESVLENPGARISFDLPDQTVRAGGKEYRFEVDSFRKQCLLNGWDDIGLSLRQADAINSFERSYDQKFAFYTRIPELSA